MTRSLCMRPLPRAFLAAAALALGAWALRQEQDEAAATLALDADGGARSATWRGANGEAGARARDRAHEGLLEYLRSSAREEGLDDPAVTGPAPDELRVTVNGEALDVDFSNNQEMWGSQRGKTSLMGNRAFRVNPNRLSLVVRGAFSADSIKNGTFQVTLTLPGDAAVGEPESGEQLIAREVSSADCPRDTGQNIQECTHGNDILHLFGDGFAVKFHQLPDNAELRIRIQIMTDDVFTTIAGTVTTADAASGDAQGSTEFLHDVGGEDGPKPKQTEITVLDLASPALAGGPKRKPPTFLENGFEVVAGAASVGELPQATEDLAALIRGAKAQTARVEVWEWEEMECTVDNAFLVGPFAFDGGDLSQQLTVLDGGLVVNALDEASMASLCGDLKDEQLRTLTHRNEVAWYSGLTADVNVSVPAGAAPHVLEDHRSRLLRLLEEIKASKTPEQVKIGIMFGKVKEQREIVLSGLEIVTAGLKLVDSPFYSHAEIVSMALELPMYNPHPRQTSSVYHRVFEEDRQKWFQAEERVLAAASAAQKLLDAELETAKNWYKHVKGKSAEGACFSLQYRSTSKVSNSLGAVTAAHVDTTTVTDWFQDAHSQQWFTHHFKRPMAEVRDHIMVAYNKWVNAGTKPITTKPLMVMDTATLDPNDLMPHALQEDLTSLLVRFRPSQRWYYQKLLQGEGYMFATSPFKWKDGRVFTGTPHSAFEFLKGPGPHAGGEDRESFEIRCLLVDYTQTADHPASSEPVDLPATVAKGALAQEVRRLALGTKLAVK